jgi:hypothetical protein
VQILSHRLAIQTLAPRDLTDAQALLMQTSDVHPILQSQHPPPSGSRMPASLAPDWGFLGFFLKFGEGGARLRGLFSKLKFRRR